jgi:hypothetical protein
MSRQHLSRVPMAVLGGLAVAAGGAVLGLWVVHATTSQIQTELANQVDAGRRHQRGRHADHAHRERVAGAAS